MTKQVIFGIILGLVITAIPQVRYVYCQMINTAVNIPKEYQNALIKNQATIDKLRDEAELAYAENQRLLDELLVLNNIVKKPGDKWIIKLENGVWKIYKGD